MYHPIVPTSTLPEDVGSAGSSGSYSAMLERPLYGTTSAFLGHCPFLFWLMAQKRPTSVVTLGGDAAAHFAACQMVKTLSLEGLCYLVAQDSAAEIREYASSHYAHISRIGNVPDIGGVDLLILPKTKPSDFAKVFDEVWRPKLAPDGIVLVFGGSDDAFVKTLCANRSAIHFSHASGLTAVGFGNVNSNFRQLCDVANHEKECVELALFARLGSACIHEYESAYQTQVAKFEMERAKDALNWANRLDNELQDLTAAYDLRHRVASELQAQLFDTKWATQALIEDLAQRTDQQHAAADQIADLKTELAQSVLEQSALARSLTDCRVEMASLTELYEQKANDSADQIADLEASLKLRFEEFAALTQYCEQQSAQATNLEAELAQSVLEQDALAGRLTDCRVEMASLTELYEQKANDAADQIVDLEASLKVRFEELATLTQHCEQQSARATNLEAELAQSVLEQNALAGSLTDCRVEMANLTELYEQKANDAANQIADLEASLKVRFDELAALTQHCEQRSARATNLEAELAQSVLEQNALARSLTDCRVEIASLTELYEQKANDAAALKIRVGELLDSTSWKVTRPMRILVDRVRRR